MRRVHNWDRCVENGFLRLLNVFVESWADRRLCFSYICSYAFVPYVPYDTCLATYNSWNISPPSPTHICAGGVKSDTCVGDSGGPLAIEAGRWAYDGFDQNIQVGITRQGGHQMLLLIANQAMRISTLAVSSSAVANADGLLCPAAKVLRRAEARATSAHTQMCRCSSPGSTTRSCITTLRGERQLCCISTQDLKKPI